MISPLNLIFVFLIINTESDTTLALWTNCPLSLQKWDNFKTRSTFLCCFKTIFLHFLHYMNTLAYHVAILNEDHRELKS